ncbi:disease resistance protein (TIR-NBS-LRR class) [Trifolium pratense]|uniref:Disease resistance protein (TIR-NBS-LRR class) n=1 Tax=Trifolium pratense TaxID=57577 RepID=A0A2K3P7G3_TRIPR|nr:disease resistance protein (TIR-NBS-LRR class) [Trifolium pratense]
MPNLEMLILTDCPMLSEISPSIGHLNEVLLINLEDCVNIRSLPRSIYKLKSLNTHILSGCLKIDKLEDDLEDMKSLTTLIANNTEIARVPFSVVRSKSIGYISLCGYEGFSHHVFPAIIWSWMLPTNNLPSPFQTPAGMSSLVPLDVQNSSSHELLSTKYLPWLRCLWVECDSELQLSRDTKIILDALYASNSKELESTATSQVSNVKTSALIQCYSQVSNVKSLFIQIGMNCQVTKILKDIILQVVLPVFYDVDPSEVRHQTGGEFGKAFQSLLHRISKEEEDKSLKWRDALHEAASLARIVVLNSREAINHIVEKVSLLLNKTNLFVADNPVGVESRVQDAIDQFQNVQQSNDVLILGIWGMGGTGKTTIAKAIDNKICRTFEGRSFLANIRETWEQPAGKVTLKEQILFDIFKKTITKIPNIESGKITLKDRLCHKRVLLVLDDVNSLDQLHALCGSREWFGSRSRIIITTRDKHIPRGNRVDKVYTMKEMFESESIELFSWNAFKQASPRNDFVGISRKIVEYSGGLPLALEVLEIGINVLVERSLVTVDDKNKLGMHDLLRDMGREIIREKSPKEPEERSREQKKLRD